MQRLALLLAFGLCGSARGSSSTGWGGQCGGVPMAIGAPSHTHGLSFTRKPQPMNISSSRTFLPEAVEAASGPGGVAGAAGGLEVVVASVRSGVGAHHRVVWTYTLHFREPLTETTTATTTRRTTTTTGV